MIETESTINVVKELKKHVNKKVIVRDIKEHKDIPKSYLGALGETSDNVIVYLNYSQPIEIIESVFVHEILHKILSYEGFPKVVINEYVARMIPPNFWVALSKLRDDFSSVIQHPEIFRRMESDFSLNMDKYYEIQVQQKINRFHKSLAISKKNEQYYFYRQQDILYGIEYFFYGEGYREKILSLFEEHYPDTYDSCSFLYRKVNRIGFYSPESCYKSAEMIREHIIKYGRRRLPNKTYNMLWEALEIKKIV